jgi:hypothetical protein
MDMTSVGRAETAVTVTDEMPGALASMPAEMPRALLFTTALTCGLLLALVVHIALTGAGAGLTSIWHTLFSSSMDQLKSALAWWAIGISGYVGSWSTILLLRRTSAGRPLHRLLRVSLGLGFFCLLAAAGHTVASAPPVETAMGAGANLAGMTFGAFMAFCATHFSIDR